MSDWITAKALNDANNEISLLSSESGLPDNHVITIRERELSVDDSELIQNNIKTDTVTLNLDREWEGIHPLILFGPNSNGVLYVEYKGEPVHIPAGAMEDVGPLDLSVMGLDDTGQVRLVTKAAPGTFTVVESGEYIGEISEDDASLLGQILSALEELKALKKQLEDIIATGTLSGDYNKLQNRPEINGVVLEGNKTLDDLNVKPIEKKDIDSLDQITTE